MKTNLKLLRGELSLYGLNPKEWNLTVKQQSQGSAKIAVRSRENDRIEFEGWVQAGTWRSLTLQG